MGGGPSRRVPQRTAPHAKGLARAGSRLAAEDRCRIDSGGSEGQSGRMPELRIDLVTRDADLERLAPIVSWAFGDTPGGALEWLKRAGSARVRMASQGGVVAGGVVEVPMAQWFGGAAVPTLGLAGVAVAPEARGRGVALGMLTHSLRLARAEGFALSTLYPSTFGLYRQLGYELAGSYCRLSLSLRRLRRARSPLDVHALGAERQGEIAALYAEVARHRTGYLDRGPYIWQRVQSPEREPARAFGVSDAQGLAGYVFVKQAKRPVPLQLALSDFVARSPEALQSLLAFLADHSTTSDTAVWHGGPADARLFGVPDPIVQVAIDDYWMLRVLDVRAALLGRGYPAVDAGIELVVHDELLPENGGAWQLVVERGRARLASGERLPAARLSVGALSALYSGFVSAHELVLSGKLEADERGMAALGALLSGPAPGLADFF